MRKQDYLLDLIHSLSPAEKRHFNLYSNLQPGNKIYFRLYELLEKEKTYNAAELSKTLKISTKKLADEKNYLQVVLLRALRNFEQDNNQPTALIHRYLEADMLYRRKMDNFALAHLDKMYEKTISYEQFGTFISCMLLRLDLAGNMRDPSPQFNSRGMFDEQMARMLQLFELNFLLNEAVPYMVNRKDTHRLADIIKQGPLTRRPEDLLTLQGKYLWYRIHNFTQSITLGAGDKPNADARSITELFENNPMLMQIKPVAYLQSFILQTVSLTYHDADKAIKILDTLIALIDSRKFAVSPRRTELLRFDALVQKINMLNATYRYAETIDIAKRLLHHQLPESYQHKKPVLLYLYAAALLFTGQGEKALLPLREILKGNNTTRLDIQLLAMALELMIQFDLGNYTIIPYSIRAIKKWMERNRLKHVDILPYLKWMLDISHAALTGDLKTELKAFLKDVNDGKIIVEPEILNIGYWLEQKLEGGK